VKLRAGSQQIRASLIEQLSDPALGDRFRRRHDSGDSALVYCGHYLRRVQRIQSHSRGWSSKDRERPFIVESNSQSGVIVSLGEMDIELEGVSATGALRLIESFTFTMDDVLSLDPKANVDEVSTLLTEVVRNGLLIGGDELSQFM
jgi:hypothetical protein